jgi:hypothetical protein
VAEEAVVVAEAADKLSSTAGHGWKIMTSASRWAAQFARVLRRDDGSSVGQMMVGQPRR